MSTFILIMIFTGYNKGGTTVAEFYSAETCEKAKTEISQQVDVGTWTRVDTLYMLCVKK